MNKTLLLSAALVLPLTLSATAFASTDPITDPKLAEARAIAGEFGKTLQPALGKAMKEGGPVHAVGMCHEVAPKIAADLSQSSGWNVNRVSLKPRGATATPDAWETKTMQWFDQELAAGKDVKTLEKFEIVKVDGQDTYRYMKAVGTAEVCLTCHGTAIPAAVKQKITEHYPTDKAVDYQLGQIRGAFSFKQTKL
ncbi:Tll0287-like domain-containing protein [Thiomicrorhabdus aquaedulcis]|uniref:Tll0287-like domain-containing protein n=1 Tax=Thiomicrorhabdus aquaedulcis TaxID=2211106 RepID=UPI000FD78B04|nr:DUF3365 domain-containing protein [Thiomicrorhabdus aquaedulcis]